jgi:trehalose synthase
VTLHRVDVGRRRLARYADVVGDDVIEQVREAAAPLRGLRVLHLNATPYGGGVAELLRSLVPLLRDVGIDAEWRVISGDAEFFRITKALHNALQGQVSELSPADREAYLRTAQHNADQLEGAYDVAVVHDPQPVPLASLRPDASTRWIWRCHIDTSSPAPDHWRFVSTYLDAYDGVVFTMREFVPPDLRPRQLFIVPPAIDPLSPKNLELGEQLASDVLAWIGIDPGDRLVTQVSRFDPWKDPLGVLAAYRLARAELPDLQLAFVGSMALDDPEGWEIYRTLQDATADDAAVHLFTNLAGVGNIEVNAFQRRSDLVVQKSTREGFGLVVAEAMWKGTPIVAGRAGGIPLQMADGAGGILVDDVAECAEAMIQLLTDPDRGRELGQRGRDRVREHFLVTRLLLDELRMLARVVRS